jgi:hypothetical protein
MRARDQAYVDKIFNHYGRKCICCDEDEIRFLTIDHINNDGNKHRRNFKQYTGAAFYRWIVKMGFPNDLQILCANCNSGKHRNGGICPHQTKAAKEIEEG